MNISSFRRFVPSFLQDKLYLCFIRVLCFVGSFVHQIRLKQLTQLYPPTKFGSISLYGAINQPAQFKQGFESRSYYAPYARTVVLKNAHVFFDSGFVISQGILYTDALIEFPQNRRISRFFIHTLFRSISSIPVTARLKKAGLYALPIAVNHNHYHRLIDLFPRLSLFSPSLPLITNCTDVTLLAKHPAHLLTNSSHYVVESLVIPVFEQDSYAGFLPEYLSYTRQSLLPTKQAKHRFIYISREDAQFRKICNESEIRLYLQKKGFVCVTLTGKSILHQADFFSGAQIIIGMHGAGMTNMLFAPKGCRIIEILPQAYVADCYYQLACALEHQYYALVAKDIVSSEIVGKWDVYCDLVKLRKIVDSVIDSVK
jgi:hypothetical protein